QALARYEAIADSSGEAYTLVGMGLAYSSLGSYGVAVSYFEQALPLLHATENYSTAARVLTYLGFVHQASSNYPQAVTAYRQALLLFQATHNRMGAASVLTNLGIVYLALGEPEQAIVYFEQALPTFEAMDSRREVATILNNLGNAYLSLNHYSSAIARYEQALAIKREIADHTAEAGILMNLGLAYLALSDYPQAIAYLEQALPTFREVADRRGEASALMNFGNAHWVLSDYRQAIVYLEQALLINRQISDRRGVADVLIGLGSAYLALGDRDQALAYFEPALATFQATEDRNGIAVALTNLGLLHQAAGHYPQAIANFKQALWRFQAIDNRSGAAYVLTYLGSLYQEQAQNSQAIAYYEQALPLFQAIGDRAGESLVFSNLGESLARQNQPELAIIFYKAAVNIREAIRGDAQQLPPTLYQSFTASIADDYRALANLLLQRNRTLEAQRILDLLKVQELDEYLQDVQRSEQTASGIDYWQPEQQILALYEQAIANAAELAELQSRLVSQLSAPERQRLQALRHTERLLVSRFTEFLSYPEVATALAALQTSTDGQGLDPEHFNQLQDNLRQLPQVTVLLYPLILEDRLELVLVTPQAPSVRYPVPVSAAELNQKLVAFGQALKNPYSDIQPLAQQLYQWLIAPLEAELAAAGAEAIIFAPDGPLRYLPLAALHDGQQWIAERFSLSHITAASLSDLNQTRQSDLRILAAACADCDFEITVGDRVFNFDDLPFTETEVTTLASQVASVDVLLNQDFNPSELDLRLGSYNIIHLATHAAFVQGSPRESFIVLGNGDRVSLQDIEQLWHLPNADLVVLSACETALGGLALGNGVEILGLGFQIQQAGARAAIASLWRVSDGGTQILMNTFYAALAEGQTKAAALQTAQQALITADFSAVGGERADIILQTRNALPVNVTSRLDHPYYWAPFILIGNGL
ncbi:CHAT domain-containing protein, partial [Almyronema epifaneia]